MRCHQIPPPLTPRSPVARLARSLTAALAAASLSACLFSGSDSNDDDGPLGGNLEVTGTVVDFRSDDAVSEGLTLEASGLAAALTFKLDGAAFTLSGIPESSAFQLLTTATGYRPTFSPTIVVEGEDLEEVKIPVVSDGFISALAGAFLVTPDPARGILLARVVDAAGMPRANVAATNFQLTTSNGTSVPKFLNDQMAAAPTALATTASGWVVFFNVAPGVASLAPAVAASITLDMAVSPINAGAVTLAQVVATDGTPPKLTNVSFSQQIVPLFLARGCVACHSGGGPGKDLGGLTLNGPTAKIYKELLEEDPTRVRPGMPEQSLLLTMPSREAPPDRHPNVTFTSAADLDFQKLYVWIKEGAKEN